MPIRILQINDRTHDYVQGFDLSEEIARSFGDDDYRFTFGVLTGTPDAGLAGRVQCEVKPFYFSKRALKPTNLKLLWTLFRYIRANQFDIVITHRFKPWLLLASISWLLPRCRFVAVMHAFKQFDRRRRQWLARVLLNKRWRLVAVSQALRADLIEHGIPADQVSVVTNTIDSEGVRAAQLSRELAREQLNVPMAATVVGTLGRSKPIKGHRYLIEAFARIAPQHPNLLLLIIGGGEEEPQLRALVQTLGLEQRVVITGTIVNAARYLKALDLFVLPSLSEGLGLAMLEAMTTGLPVIGTRAGGVPEAVGPHGVLVPRADAQALAQAIDDLLGWSAEQRATYVAQLQQHLEAEFSIAQYHRRYRALAAEMMQIKTG